MIIITCTRCRQKLLKYQKIGKGRILRCYKKRITRIYHAHTGNDLRCSCGQLIGIDEGKWYKMKQQAFETSGQITKR
jgi:hypothetical protein